MDSVTTNKFSWGKLATGTVAIVGLVGSVVGIASGVLPGFEARHAPRGTWTLMTQTEHSTENNFKGMELKYSLNLTCNGTHITGKGEKLGEQLAGKGYTPYAGKARTPIYIDGSVDGNSLDALFTESGEIRKTSGHLALKWDGKSKSWFGTFDSEAATSSGTASLSSSTD